MTTSSQRFNEKNDGILLALMSFAASEFGWELSYILDQVSMLSLLLLLRQKAANSGQLMMSLADKEAIDGSSWSKLVEESHRRVAAAMMKT